MTFYKGCNPYQSSARKEWLAKPKEGSESTAKFRTQDDCFNEIKVESRTLDGLIAQYGKPAYIKIDVEGAEEAAIKGLSTAIPMISWEFTYPEASEDSWRIARTLHGAPYHMRYFALAPPDPFEYVPPWNIFHCLSALEG